MVLYDGANNFYGRYSNIETGGITCEFLQMKRGEGGITCEFLQNA